MKEAIEAMKSERARTQWAHLGSSRQSRGLLTSATDICDMFLESATIVSTKGRNGRFETRISAEAAS